MGSTFDVKCELIFEYLRGMFYAKCLGTWNRLVQKKKVNNSFLPTETPDHFWPFTLWKACGQRRHVFGASTRPRPWTKKLVMSPSSTVHGGQHDTKYVTFELLLHAAFVADEIWGCMLEPARSNCRPVRSHTCCIVRCNQHRPTYLFLPMNTMFVNAVQPRNRTTYYVPCS